MTEEQLRTALEGVASVMTARHRGGEVTDVELTRVRVEAQRLLPDLLVGEPRLVPRFHDGRVDGWQIAVPVELPQIFELTIAHPG